MKIDRTRPETIPSCTGIGPDAGSDRRQRHPSEGRLLAPDGKAVPGGFYCREHATVITDEYKAKLGQVWTFEPFEEDKHECAPENAAQMRQWIETRGGVAIWRSVNLSNPGASWSTPALQKDGTPTQRPTWESDKTPERVITRADDIVVVSRKEVKRFHVAVRTGSQGMSLKLTDGATRRVREAVAKAGDGAAYDFDYSTQEAVITVPDKSIPLSEYQTGDATHAP